MTEAAPAKCLSSANHDCYWVVKAWQAMGKPTTVDPSSPTGCCGSVGSGIPGVRCSPDHPDQVFSIYWAFQGLSGSIPDYISNLKNVQYL